MPPSFALVRLAGVTPDGLILPFDSSKITVTIMQDMFRHVMDLSMLDGFEFPVDIRPSRIDGNEWGRAAGITPEIYLQIFDQLQPFHRGMPLIVRVEALGYQYDYKMALAPGWDAATTAQTRAVGRRASSRPSAQARSRSGTGASRTTARSGLGRSRSQAPAITPSVPHDPVYNLFRS